MSFLSDETSSTRRGETQTPKIIVGVPGAAELTAEQRQRIYLEEKARLEIRQELKGQKKGAGHIIGKIVLGGIGVLFVLFIIGSIMENSENAAFNALTPEQRHAKTLENCVSLMRSFALQTYSEMSALDRRMQASCAEQLRHPDQNIIKQ